MTTLIAACVRMLLRLKKLSNLARRNFSSEIPQRDLAAREIVIIFARNLIRTSHIFQAEVTSRTHIR